MFTGALNGYREDEMLTRDDELFMCATDYECELGMAAGGVGVYASVADLKASRPCVAECGIVAVRVEYVRNVEQGRMK